MKKLSLMSIILIIFLMIVTPVLSNANSALDLSGLKETNLGIGGGGVLHSPEISPFDVNTMIVIPDMGGIYVSHNKGEKWNRKNLKGLIETVCFDPNREGTIYAGGSGLYKSQDNGDTFKMIFPKEEDVVARRYNREDLRQYIYTKDKKYPAEKSVKDVIVNPNNSDNIFVLMYYGKNGTVYESTDNGESFKELFSYKKSKSQYNVWQDYNELIYQKETNTLYYVTDDGVYKYNKETKKAEIVYESELGLVKVVPVFEDGKTKFIVIENSKAISKCQTEVYYTENFINKTDLTQKIIKELKDSFDSGSYKNVQFNWRFTYIDATSTDNIYIAHNNMSNNSNYPYRIAGLIKFDGKKGTWVYGHPYKNHSSSALVGKGWADGNIHSYGVTVSDKDKRTLLYTTLCGIYYSPDGESFYQKYSTKLGNDKFVTSGIDEQTTYGVVTNPFDKNNLLLLNSDLGMIRSEDNGKSWTRVLQGVKSEWTNSAYDAEFDKNKQGVVYALWSGRSTMPYNPGNETDGFCKGGFAISYDAGKTWDCEYSSGLPQNSTPMKMSVVYPENSNKDVTIYVATLNNGFYVSTDSGKTFKEMNNGIEKVKYKEDDEKYHYILAADIEVKDGRIFGMTARSAYNNSEQPGEVFEYKNNKWEKIELPENTKIPRDIYYNDGVLYISSTPTLIWDYKNGADFSNYGGGIIAYKDGKFERILDESIGGTGVQISSDGIMYVSDFNGNIYRKEPKGELIKIYDSFHSISKGIKLENDDMLYLATLGGGVLRLEGLKSLKNKEELLGDINGNGKIDVDDLARLKLHLIGKKLLTADEEKRADVDKSKRIDINDLAKIKLILIE